MKKLLLIIFFTSLFLPIAYAEIKDYVYDGKEIYVHVKKEHVTVVIFPEPITAVIRGFGADPMLFKEMIRNPILWNSCQLILKLQK